MTVVPKKAFVLLLTLRCGDTFPAGMTSKKMTTALHVQKKDSIREDEIRRKILKLKKEGRIRKLSPESEIVEKEATLDKLRRGRQSMKSNPATEAYADKIRDKLGKKGQLLKADKRTEKLGKLFENDDNHKSPDTTDADDNSELEYNDDDVITEDDEEQDEMDMVQMVEKRLGEKRRIDAVEKNRVRVAISAPETTNVSSLLRPEEVVLASAQTTSGIGGTWIKNETISSETYRPSRGSWGYFPRPKDISRTYGGGKRVGAGVPEDELSKAQSAEDTKERLRQYREKVGIDVQSEKDHVAEIEEALAVAQRAMQRGIYSTAVLALGKVTKWCSTNSELGGQVFLELAMAYEAVGRTQEAITVYTTLSNCRIEKIKFDAKRLLFGIEALNFMRNDAKIESFSRKRASQTFIDTTGLGRIADNFDKVYNTAYIDLERGGGFYRKLTESVVRSVREARQILLKATGSREVERLKVVQALRSINRQFDDALEKERKVKSPSQEEEVALMNGIPIIAPIKVESSLKTAVEVFFLTSPLQTMKNMDGEWKLQLTADKKGDGVKYYNTSLSWQVLNSNTMTFRSLGTAGFLTISQNGHFEFEDERRIVRKSSLQTKGTGAWLASVVSSNPTGSAAAICLPQQIVLADSELLITRCAEPKKTSNDNVKDYFSVWRRVESGTYSL